MRLKHMFSGMLTSLSADRFYIFILGLIVFLYFKFPVTSLLLQYNFEGRNDLVRFIKTIQEAGLYAILRIGPYVCAEWNYG